jgi:hypothetical protein
MANENARRDDNRVTSMLGVTNDANQEIRNLLIDPATGALLVTGAGGGTGQNTFAVSPTDTTPGTFIEQSTAGDGIDFTIVNGGANENLTISVDALNGLEFVGGTLYWGGTLLQNTTIDGNAQSESVTFTGIDMMSFDDITDFTVGTSNDVAQVNLVGQGGMSIATSVTGVLQVQTPAVGTAGLNWVLSNVGINGESEWVDPTTLPAAVAAEICDADNDTCVEVERTADDDTIRFKAANVDMMTATSTAFDVFGGVDINLTRGNFNIFNDATGFFGTDSVGFSEIDGTETFANYIQSGVNATMVYNNTVGNVVNQIRVNTGAATVNAAGIGYSTGLTANSTHSQQFAADGAGNSTDFTATPTTIRGLVTDGTVFNGFTVTQTSVSIQAFDGINDADIEVAPEVIDIDVKTGEFFLNEGTTTSGTGAATNGMVLTLLDDTTGEAQWAAAPPEPRYEIRQNGNGSTQLTAAGIGQFVAVQYDTEIISSPDFTLGGGGVITCNTAGDYRIQVQTNMGTLPTGGTVGVFVYRLYVNGIATADQMYQTYERNSEWQQATVSQDVTLAVNDTLEYRLIRNGGGRDITSVSTSNRLLIHTLA